MANPATQITTSDDLAPEMDGEAAPVRSQFDIEAALVGTIGKLQALADKQVHLKSMIEQRWLEDLRQFHGRYDTTTEQQLKDAKTKSKVFVNLTRAKVNSWEARLTDLLFPTDDKNWGIKPAPSPQLAEAAKRAVQIANQAAQKATEAHQGGDPAQGAAIAAQGNSAAQAGASIQDEIDEAEKRAGLMEAEIETQLRESDYNIRSRQVIRDSVKIGTGVMKGPVTSQKLRRSWAKVTTAPAALMPPANDASQPQDLRPWMGDQPQPQPQTAPQPAGATAPGSAFQLNLSPDPAPEFLWIDPWSYFPDMSARTPDEAEFHFERHLWNAKQIRDAVKRVGLDPEASADLLRAAPMQAVPTYWAQLREITSNSNIIGMEKRYQVWEYQGVLEDEDLQSIAEATGDKTIMEFVRDNPLLEVPVVLWFCQGKLLKFAPYPLDSCESLYSVVNFEEDDTSMFGFGVPYLMRDPQAALNGSWRMMMDNGGLSVGPQIVIDQDAIKPVAGDDWSIRPMKVWLKSSTTLTKMPEGYKPFETHEITANQAQLQNIITLARQFADDETSMPLIAAGDQATHITKTSTGMSMLMNSANVVFRRVVKNFDDCISTPNIRRIYDWNMQFSKREDIKGDYHVDARGSSVLLEKQTQSQNLLLALNNWSNHPIIGPGLKVFPLVRKFFQSQMIHADDAVKSDEVIEQEAQARAQQAQQQPQPTKEDPEVVKLKLASAEQIAQGKNQTEVAVAKMAQDTALMTLAQQHNMTLDQLQTQLQINQDKIAHDERVFAAEVAMPAATKIGGSEFTGGPAA